MRESKTNISYMMSERWQKCQQKANLRKYVIDVEDMERKEKKKEETSSGINTHRNRRVPDNQTVRKRTHT